MKTRLGLWMGLALLGMQLTASAALPKDAEKGICTDRLSARHLKVWRAMEDIALAVDSEALPLHPKMCSLLRILAAGPHKVYIEMLTPVKIESNAAGKFKIEGCDPDGQACTVVILLNLRVIDKAASRADLRVTDEFAPFKGLGKVERYVEVLAHELQHAVCALDDPLYASAIAEMDRQSRELVDLLRQKGKLREQDKRERLERLQALARRLESPAETAEVEIWKELRQSQPQRIAATRRGE